MINSESKEIHKVTNHPVHLQTKDENDRVNLSPTAMIPFCEFGGNLSVMGIKIDQFTVPVCNSFRPKIIKDQLCYTVDPNEYKNKIDLKGDLSISLLINFNEDREMYSEHELEEDHSIMIQTIGKIL